jgi:DNA-directed RNA polymerase subunit RPC12/RpoP
MGIDFVTEGTNLMSLQHCLPDQVVRANSRTLFCPECSQQMRMVMATPAQEDDETSTYECACGHQEMIKVGLQGI